MASMTRIDGTRIDELFAHQDGLATRGQLVACGMADRTVDERCRPGGRWTRVLPCVVAGFTGELMGHQRRRAVLLWAGPRAAITGDDAARMHGLRYLSQSAAHPIQVLLPHEVRRKPTGFAAVRRTRVMPPVWVRDGLQVVTPARAVIDACRAMDSLRDVRALVAEAVQRGRTTTALLERELDCGGSAGSRLVRRALEELRAGVRSAPEADCRDLVRAARLPEPLWNHDLYTPDGEWIARPDGWWIEGVAFEADSREYHLSPAGWEATMRRHERMSACGIVVVHASPRRIRDCGAELAENVRAALAAASRRPLPDLVAVPAGTPFLGRSSRGPAL